MDKPIFGASTIKNLRRTERGEYGIRISRVVEGVFLSRREVAHWKFLNCRHKVVQHEAMFDINSLMATLKLQNYASLCSNTYGTLAVDEWAVTFGTARRGLSGGAAARPGSSSL